jgi:hypothetical protein
MAIKDRLPLGGTAPSLELMKEASPLGFELRHPIRSACLEFLSCLLRRLLLRGVMDDEY